MMARTKGKKTVVEATPKEEPSRAKGGGATHGKISKGDIVWIDYEGWIVSPNGTRTLFDTTREEVAKKADKFEEKKVYTEFPIIVGHGRIIPGLDEALLNAEIGKDVEITIPPEKGAG